MIDQVRITFKMVLFGLVTVLQKGNVSEHETIREFSKAIINTNIS